MTLSGNNKENGYEWTKVLEIKLKGVEQHMHVKEEEKVTIKKKLQDINKCFNNDNNAKKQQLIGCRELFKGMIVK